MKNWVDIPFDTAKKHIKEDNHDLILEAAKLSPCYITNTYLHDSDVIRFFFTDNQAGHKARLMFSLRWG